MRDLWLFQRHADFPLLSPGWVRVSLADATTLITASVAQDGYDYVTALAYIKQGVYTPP